MKRCVICGSEVNRNKAHILVDYEGDKYLLCCPICQAEFEKNPKKYTNDGNTAVTGND